MFYMKVDTQLAECAECLCLASRQVARLITRAFEKHLRPYGIRATQFSILAMLEIAGSKSISELAVSLGVDPTTLTRNLAHLKGRALIRIQPGDDARSRIVHLTSKGRNTFMRAIPAWRQAQELVLTSIGSHAAENLRRLARVRRI
jgi:DNA-binding MarR family transcriptional regulator